VLWIHTIAIVAAFNLGHWPGYRPNRDAFSQVPAGMIAMLILLLVSLPISALLMLAKCLNARDALVIFQDRRPRRSALRALALWGAGLAALVLDPAGVARWIFN